MNMDKKRVMATRTALAVVLLINIASCTPKNGNDSRPTKCMAAPRLAEMMAHRADLIDKSEYEVLEAYGKPPMVSMNPRSEKLYYYQPCDSGAATVIIRYSGTGRVKEVYWK